MTSVYERLKNLQITLPDVPPPVVDGYVAAFAPFVRTGNLIYLSGRLAKKNGKLWCGKLGEEITTAEGNKRHEAVATFCAWSFEAIRRRLSSGDTAFIPRAC